ncbi:ABC transporter ATP-binding protein [Cucumibacter marinus]|uniref:ABC transporter ATP-binding protein n=1 Tax=Cucumibacter marinus TaxID=1121252 RepID=UPI0003F78713|nr:ABC transporter ATP-binding protein [Cucumibacter marinus]
MDMALSAGTAQTGLEDLTGSRPAALTIDSLDWGPARDRLLLRGIGVDVKPGEMLAIVGPNGAGKSSLLRCLYRFQRPLSGRVCLDGEDIWGLNPRACAKRIATVVQEPASDMGLSVAEVVEMGLTPHAERWGSRPDDYRRIEQALDLMGLEVLAPRNFASLSGGEKQRVLIARALAQKPDLLILDEPTNHLDIRHQLELLEMLSALPATVIVTLHDLALATAHADRVLLLDGGEAVALGSPKEVLTAARIRQSFAVETTTDCHPVTGRPRFSFHLSR